MKFKIALIVGLAAVAYGQTQITRDPLTSDELAKQLGICRAGESLNLQMITKLQARIKELETPPKASAVPKLP